MMISMVILGMISFALYQCTVQTYQLRDSLSADGDFNISIRVGIAMLERDIASFYSPLGFVPQPVVSATNPSGSFLVFQSNKPYQDQFAKQTQYWSAAISELGVKPSRFQGKATEMSFVVASHVRVYRDMLDSVFAKVAYSLKKDPSEGALGDMLVKTEDSAAFADDDFKSPYLKSVSLLRGVKKLRFSYLKRDGKVWKQFSSWDSSRSENGFLPPDMIQMEIVLKGPQNLYFEAVLNMRPEVCYAVPLQF
jgi:hypothetical protein